MSVTMQDGKMAEEKDILALEEILGCRLSSAVRSFLERNDGAVPESNAFTIGDDNESGVDEFIPVRQIPAERALLETQSKTTYPIASAEGGNYVVIDEAMGGKVFFWDHEILDGLTELASDFGAFLELLRPFDTSTIQPKPGQVMHSWIDPEFLKSLKDK